MLLKAKMLYNFFMQRVKLKIQYDGSDFVGWQKQKNGRSVQEEIEKAIEKLVGEKVTLVGSSRTDAKVHALCQVAHFDLNSQIPAKNLKSALNDLLSKDVRIASSQKVPMSFHARFDVKKKTYVYLLQATKDENPLLRKLAAHTNFSLDLQKMRSCAKLFEGTHNFKGFCSAHAQVKTFERTIFVASVTKSEKFFKFTFTGSGFLQHMVRIMVGTIVDVGRGKLSLDDVKQALETGNRAKAGKTMEPQGLYLKRIYF